MFAMFSFVAWSPRRTTTGSPGASRIRLNATSMTETATRNERPRIRTTGERVTERRSPRGTPGLDLRQLTCRSCLLRVMTWSVAQEPAALPAACSATVWKMMYPGVWLATLRTPSGRRVPSRAMRSTSEIIGSVCVAECLDLGHEVLALGDVGLLRHLVDERDDLVVIGDARCSRTGWPRSRSRTSCSS